MSTIVRRAQTASGITLTKPRTGTPNTCNLPGAVQSWYCGGSCGDLGVAPHPSVRECRLSARADRQSGAAGLVAE
jgi:hypothetical protein